MYHKGKEWEYAELNGALKNLEYEQYYTCTEICFKTKDVKFGEFLAIWN